MTAQIQLRQRRTAADLKRIAQNLFFAQQKLLNPQLPHQMKVISYVRICCRAIYAEQSLGLGRSAVATLNTNNSYLTLLSRLAKSNPQWWNQCRISDSGYLVSNNPIIRDLLQPLNAFVAQHLEVQAA